MLLLYQPGMDPTRVYEGTDTRAFGLLIGAMLALAWPSKKAATSARQRTAPAPAQDGREIAAATSAGFAGLGRGSACHDLEGRGVLAVRLPRRPGTAVGRDRCRGRGDRLPGSIVGAALGWRPLRWIGVRSYGIYLWHYPVIVMTTPANTKPSLPTAGLQIAASILLAALSWQLIEEPIRHGAIGRAWAKVRLVGWRRTLRQANLPGLAATTGTVAVVVVVAGAGLSGAVRTGAGSRVGSVLSEGSLQLPVTKTVVKAPKRQASGGASPSPAATAPGGTAPAHRQRAASHVLPRGRPHR